MTTEEIERGLCDLGLGDANARLSLQRLANLVPQAPAPSYETVTAAHTAGEPAGVPDAELEPGS